MAEHVITALHDVELVPPPQPARLAEVKRRAVRLRRGRRLAAGLTAAAVLVSGGLLAGGVTHSAHTEVPASDPATWPERSPAGSDPAPGLLALTQWEARQAEHVLGPVHWLFRGHVDSGADPRLYIAVWTVRRDGQEVVVASTRRAYEFDIGPHPAAPYEQFTTREETGARALVGLYLPHVEQEHVVSHSGAYTDLMTTPGNTLFVLADPAVRRVSWQQQALSGATLETGFTVRGKGLLSSLDGVFVGSAGLLQGPVQMNVDGTTVDLGGQLSDPVLGKMAPAPTPEGLPGGGELNEGQDFQHSAGSWAVMLPQTGWQASYDSFNYERRAGTYALEGRCAGGGQLEVAVRAQQGGRTYASGSLTCDGEPHEVLRATVAAGGVVVHITFAQRLQQWQLQRGFAPAAQ